MEKILSVLENIKGYLPLIRLADLLDVAIVAYLVYKLLSLVKSTRAANILKGVAIFLAALWLSSKLNLRVVNYILSHMVEWGVLALIIVFQPEIRRILEQLGSKNIRLLRTLAPEKELPELERAIDQTVLACTEMSRTRTGVLIVFERKILLDDVVRSGTTLDASVSSELLKNIFFVKAPMHDGAVIIRNGRILGAGCMLPLSKNVNLSRDLGMRHRAGIGMSENSDAVVVIVSEETGSISVAIGGMLKRHLQAETLSQLLHNELMPQQEETDKVRFPLRELLRAPGGCGRDFRAIHPKRSPGSSTDGWSVPRRRCRRGHLGRTLPILCRHSGYHEPIYQCHPRAVPAGASRERSHQPRSRSR